MMRMMRMQRVFCISMMLLLSVVNGEKGVVSGKAGVQSLSGAPFVRLFHSSGAVGSRTNKNSDSDYLNDHTAPLLHLTSSEQLTTFLTTKQQQQTATLLLPLQLLSTSLVKKQNQIAGLICYNTTTSTSPDSKSPQGPQSFDGKHLNPFSSSLNPNGSNLLNTEFPHFPVFLLSPTDKGQLDTLIRKAQANDKQNTFIFKPPVYTANMRFYFGPQRMDSFKCLAHQNIYKQRAPKCDPVGGQSVWGYTGSEKKLQTNRLIHVMTNLDANAIAHQYATGANFAVSNVVGLLAAADALKTTIDETVFTKTIVFNLFQGEKYGFVGSRMFLHDLKKKDKLCQQTVKTSSTNIPPYGDTSFCTFPYITSNTKLRHLDLKRIDAILSVDGLGITDKKRTFYWHPNPNNAKSTAQRNLFNEIQGTPTVQKSGNASMKEILSDLLPPGPLSSFLNEKEFGKKDIVSGVFTGYGKTFNSNVYGSQFDTKEKVDVKSIAQGAQILAETLFRLGTSPGAIIPTTLKVNATFVSELFECLTSDWECNLMRSYSRPFITRRNRYHSFSKSSYPMVTTKPVHYYPGVYRQSTLRLPKSSAAPYLKDPKQFDEKHSQLKVEVNAFEVFIRSFLASTLSLSDKTEESCSNDEFKCKEEHLTCVYPSLKCVNNRVFFQDARSPHLEVTSAKGVFDITKDKKSILGPIWTEPQWDTLSARVYADPGVEIGIFALICGVVVLLLSLGISRWILKRFQKHKIL